MIFAEVGSVHPTTVIGLLSFVVTAILMGVGWAGKRLLGDRGLIEKWNESQHEVAMAQAGTNSALEAVAACVKQHDERAAHRHDSHHTACDETRATVGRMFGGVVEACNVAERACRERNMEHEAEEIARIRSELTRS